LTPFLTLNLEGLTPMTATFLKNNASWRGCEALDLTFPSLPIESKIFV